MKLINKITPIEIDFAKWYTDVVINGNLIDYGPIKGTIIFKPNAYGIWENIQIEFNKIIKNHPLNVQNVYLPLLIPSSLIEKEKEHISGFAPELATINYVGDKKLSEKIFIRPTSEVLFALLFKNSINSYNDLPLKYNQWANVVRWEKTTNPFLRNSEFLWQEGHTCHQNEKEANEFSLMMLNVYEKFLKDFLAIPVIKGIKSESEKFAGAKITYTVEAMMKDGKALQSGTSHYLGQNFSKIYDIKFKDENNNFSLVHQTSWGISTRLIGALIMTHGDNRGIIIPPFVAPIQVEIILINHLKNNNVLEIGKKIQQLLIDNNFRVKLNQSDQSVGFKAAQSEIEGIPLRIEIGPRDLEQNNVIFVLRNTLEKRTIKINDVLNETKKTLGEIQKKLYDDAYERMINNVTYTNNYEQFKKLIKEKKFIIVPLIENEKFEEKIKEETGATSRCIPFDFKMFNVKIPQNDQCIISKEKTNRFIIFAKAY